MFNFFLIFTICCILGIIFCIFSQKKHKVKVHSFILLISVTFIAGCTAEPPAKKPTETDNVQKADELKQEKAQENGSNQTAETEINIEQQSAVKPILIPAVVTRVIDGDTIEINMNGKTEVVRLLLVDTPETKHPAKPVQPFGLEASNFAKATLTRKQVGIEIDISERDNYGRLLAYLWIGDKMFNEMLLEKALARVAYIYPPNTKYVDQFRSIQEKAQKQALGIWSLENYSSEEGFETDGQTAEGPSNESKTPGTGSCKIKGNISSSGEKIYHVSGSQHYDITKAEEMFCTEEEAEAAGYRASKR